MLLEKDTIPMVAMEFMNQVHLKDLDIINELYELVLQYEQNPNDTNKTLLNSQYEKWFEHTIEHFSGEEKQMLEKKFPPYPMHKAEHDRVLALINDLYLQWKQTNDITVLKNFLKEELPTWLIQHINSMDTVTARFLRSNTSSSAIKF